MNSVDWVHFPSLFKWIWGQVWQSHMDSRTVNLYQWAGGKFRVTSQLFPFLSDSSKSNQPLLASDITDTTSEPSFFWGSALGSEGYVAAWTPRCTSPGPPEPGTCPARVATALPCCGPASGLFLWPQPCPLSGESGKPTAGTCTLKWVLCSPSWRAAPDSSHKIYCRRRIEKATPKEGFGDTWYPMVKSKMLPTNNGIEPLLLGGTSCRDTRPAFPRPPCFRFTDFTGFSSHGWACLYCCVHMHALVSGGVFYT